MNSGMVAAVSQRSDSGRVLWIPVALTLFLIGVLGTILPASSIAAVFIAGACLAAAWTNRLFAIEGYVCALAVYYWLGIANPFKADVHQVEFQPALVREVTAFVIVGGCLLWTGCLLGRRAVQLSPSDIGRHRRGPELLARAYRASFVCLGAGGLVAILCYLRLGIPALADNQDLARTAFVDALSPYTGYQWLFIEVGVGLAAYCLAVDRSGGYDSRRWLIFAAGCGSLIILGGESSRAALATPVVLGAIVWWSQGRRIPWYAAVSGAIAAILVIGVVWIIRTQAIGNVAVYNVEFNFGGRPWETARTILAALSIFARTSTEVFAMFVRGDLPKLHGEVAFMSIIALLPGKQSDLGLFHISQLLGYESFQGTTVSLFGGMYADFGVFGVLLLSPMLGWVLGFLERRSQTLDGLDGLYYGVVLSYYLNMIYGGQLLDVSLLWKLWLAAMVVRYVRTGQFARTRPGVVQAVVTAGLYGYGVVRLAMV